jgi:hypothetical protein
LDRSVIEGRGMLFVDSYWRIDDPVGRDLWLRARVVPRDGDEANIWYGDHEPCDWAWPTSRWLSGVIYRDRYGIRPPKPLAKGDYVVVFGVAAGSTALDVERPIASIRVK